MHKQQIYFSCHIKKIKLVLYQEERLIFQHMGALSLLLTKSNKNHNILIIYADSDSSQA